jgi:hypothetical protein
VRFFTPEEANEALTAVRPLVKRIVAANGELRRRRAELHEVRGKVAGNGGGLDPGRVSEVQSAAEALSASVAATLDELAALGVQVKDLDTGLVDFPATHPSGGEPVLLCWRLGEDEVGFWHELEGGFAGRKPLPF